MAQITFLGTGNASVPLTQHSGGGFDCAWQSNLLLTTNNGERILLDCGTDIRHSAFEQGLGAGDFDAVYISHVHDDHCGGLAWLAINTFFRTPRYKPHLYCRLEILNGIRATVEPLVSPLAGAHRKLEDFFDIFHYTEKWQKLTDTFDVYAIRVLHLPGPVEKISYGLLLTNRQILKTLFWTSDTVFEPTKYTVYYEKADIILQDCELGFKTTAHPHIDDLRTLPGRFKRKMILYHHDPAEARIMSKFVLPNEFMGFAHKGLTIEF